ncbi:C39 family peptidase, partial [Candidatus Woesebacteria bacterium]|nr:C39 family peptidase [Candidatus Woesebacteria bacterium]
MKLLVIALSLLSLLVVGLFLSQNSTTTPIVTAQDEKVMPTPPLKPLLKKYIIPQKTQVNQTFNNCGPASLSMLFSYQDVTVTQEVLGQKLRPYQNPVGDNDDKSVSMEELAEETKQYNLLAYHRPHGSMILLKTLINNNIPVLVRTWLHPNEDIGHFRIIRGYDDETQEIIQDDSYEGGNLRQTYDVFENTWQPFNYEYMVVVPSEKKEMVEQLLGTDTDNSHAWQNAYEQAIREAKTEPQNPYPVFNQSRALFHLNKYQEAQQIYESIQSKLPPRM